MIKSIEVDQIRKTFKKFCLVLLFPNPEEIPRIQNYPKSFYCLLNFN